MASKKKMGALIVVCLMLASFSLAFAPLISAQLAHEHRVVVRTDYEMLGTGNLHGGGHLTYELHGQAAGDLRRAVLADYDGFYPPYSQNNLIDPAELKNPNQERGFIADVERELMNTQFFHGSTVRYDPLHENQGEDITADAIGFVEVFSNIASDNTTSIFIHLYFDASYMSGTFNQALVVQELFDALYSPLIPDPNPLSETLLDNGIDFNDYRFEYHHVDYRVSLGSFYRLQNPWGSMHVIRTPAGEITTYHATGIEYRGTVSSLPVDRASYSSFNFVENPQIMFIMVFICCYFISSMPTKFFADYKFAYPRRLRHKALKITWLHIINKVLILLLLLFFFFPTMFGFLGLKSFISGVVIWILAPVLTVVISVLAKLLYDQKMTDIPQAPEPKPLRREARRPAPTPTTTTPAGVNVVFQQPGQQTQQQPVPAAAVRKATPKGPPCNICGKPILDYMELEKCKCGAIFHDRCKDSKEECPKCSTPFEELVEEEKAPEDISIQCPTCGEMNTVPEGADLLTTKCNACEVILMKTDPGFNYLIIDDNRTTAFEMLVSMIKKGSPGLCISTTFPEKLKKQHDMGATEIIWLTDTSAQDQKTMNPHRLEFEMMRTYASFVKNNSEAAVLLDGFEYMVVENGFEKVFKFIKKVNDLSSVNTATLFVPIGTSSLETDQLGILKKEFDKVVETEDDKED